MKGTEKWHRGNGDIRAYDIEGKSTIRPIFSGRIRRDTWRMPLAFTATSVHADRAGRPKTRTYVLLMALARFHCIGNPPQCSPTGFTLHTTQDRGSVQRVKIRIFPIGLTVSAAGTIFDWPLPLCPVSAPNNRFLQVTPLACPMIHQV